MNKYEFFWKTMERCDWSNEGDDDKVLMPVVKYLSKQDDNAIFEFDDLMSELLYGLDTKKLADQCQKADPYMSDDTFLYSRCVALINGSEKRKKYGTWSSKLFSISLKEHGQSSTKKRKKNTRIYRR